jgi:hypothetical protein
MAWTRDTLVDELRLLTDQPHTAILTAAKAASLINNAYRELLGKILQRNCDYFYTSSSLPTVSGSRFAALPATCLGVKSIVDADGAELPWVSMLTFDTTLTTGEPTGYDVTGRKVIFDTIADAIYTYTLWHSYFPADMSTGSSAPEFVPGFEDLIATLAAIKSKMIGEDKVDIATLYPDRLQVMLGNAGTRQTQASRRVHRSIYQDSDL